MLYDQYFLDDLRSRSDLVVRFFLLVALVCILAIYGKAQEVRKAVLFTEFGSLPCEHILGQTDAFATELQKQAETTAAIIIHRPKVQPTLAERRRRLISSTLQLRGIEKARISFFLVGQSEDGEIRTSYWRVPPGATAPINETRLWNEPEPDVSQSFMFGYEDEIDICPTYVPKAFAKIILENPGSIGRIIVKKGPDPMEYPSFFAARLIKDLVENHKVPRKRLRLIFRKGKEMTAAEFWFVPSKKK
ncbi:MAG: hypothetical protein AB7Q37_08500 [Pyrinomonadaceae bacterium]